MTKAYSVYEPKSLMRGDDAFFMHRSLMPLNCLE